LFYRFPTVEVVFKD
jgi:hypothetical protein